MCCARPVQVALIIGARMVVSVPAARRALVGLWTCPWLHLLNSPNAWHPASTHLAACQPHCTAIAHITDVSAVDHCQSVIMAFTPKA